MMPGNEAAFIALRWWQQMQPKAARDDPGNPVRNQSGDRAALARLRRCPTVKDSMQDPATLLLFRDLHATTASDLPTVGLAAAVLAHVRSDIAGAAARLVGPDSLEKPETARLKPLRFRRLMEADGAEDRLIAFRRLVAIAGHTLPVRDLAAALLDWTDHRRIRWTLEYWNAAPAPVAVLTSAPAKDAIP